MFDKPYDQQVVLWKEFRKQLETSDDPINDCIKFYSRAPYTSIHTDPYDNTVWPTPWELLNENQYCNFCIILGICYTLQLTERFKDSHFEIHIDVEKATKETVYLLYVEGKVIGLGDEWVKQDDLNDSFYPEKIYQMPKLN